MRGLDRAQGGAADVNRRDRRTRRAGPKARLKPGLRGFQALRLLLRDQPGELLREDYRVVHGADAEAAEIGRGGAHHEAADVLDPGRRGTPADEPLVELALEVVHAHFAQLEAGLASVGDELAEAQVARVGTIAQALQPVLVAGAHGLLR